MKKVWQFARSMRFGVILLTAIGVLCVLATVFDMEVIYHSWYFVVLFALLCVNLLLCSVIRVKNIGAQKRSLLQRAGESELQIPMPAERQQDWLKRRRFREQDGGVYLRCGAGFFGSFITHVALMLLLAAAVCNFTLAQKSDYSIFVGESATLEDGTVLRVDDFAAKDENGSLQYRSSIHAVLPDGSEQDEAVRVNYPAHIGKYKIYQQNYSNAAVIGVRTGIDEPEELVRLDDSAFLSLDGENGLYYITMYGNVIEDEAGVAVSASPELINPAYEVQLVNREGGESGLVYPGTTLEAGGIYFTMCEPESYPGLLVKSQPEWTLWFLYLSFALMLLGLYLCFFHVPVSAVPDGKKAIFVAGRKDIGDWVENETEEC